MRNASEKERYLMDLSKEDIQSKVFEFLEDECGLDTDGVTSATSLFAERRLSSLDAVQLLTFFQSEFGLNISPFEVKIDKFDNVDLITDFVLNKSAEA